MRTVTLTEEDEQRLLNLAKKDAKRWNIRLRKIKCIDEVEGPDDPDDYSKFILEKRIKEWVGDDGLSDLLKIQYQKRVSKMAFKLFTYLSKKYSTRKRVKFFPKEEGATAKLWMIKNGFLKPQEVDVEDGTWIYHACNELAGVGVLDKTKCRKGSKKGLLCFKFSKKLIQKGFSWFAISTFLRGYGTKGLMTLEEVMK